MLRRHFFTNTLALLGLAAAEQEVKIVPLRICVKCSKPIGENEDAVLRMFKGVLKPVHFYHAYEEMRKREAEELAARF